MGRATSVWCCARVHESFSCIGEKLHVRHRRGCYASPPRSVSRSCRITSAERRPPFAKRRWICRPQREQGRVLMNIFRDLSFARRNAPRSVESVAEMVTYDQKPWNLLYKAVIDSTGASPKIGRASCRERGKI